MWGLPVDAVQLIGLLLAALTAGWVDAVVGGGGLIQLPALLLGLPASTPVASVAGTNKLSSLAGTATATATYLRRVRVDAASALLLMVCAGLGSAGGAQLVRFLPREVFTPLVLVVLLGVGTYTWRRPALGLVHGEKLTGRRRTLALGAIGALIGAYDGFLGPGTGTFLVIALVAVLGFGFLEASAYAKLANATTNVAALAVFATHGHVWWLVGALMAAANLVGGLVGARLAVRYGNGFVRRVFLVVVGALALKLGYDTVGWVVLATQR